MSFKNAIKLLCSKFSLVWGTLLFLVVMTTIVVSLATQPVIDLINWIKSTTLGDEFVVIWQEFSRTGDFVPLLVSGLDVISQAYSLLILNQELFLNFTLRMFFIVFFLYKFLLTTFENALTQVNRGFMTDNAKTGFFASYVSLFLSSLLYALVKTIVFTLFNLIIIAVLYFSAKAVTSVPVFIPFVFMGIFIFFMALRSSLFFAWSPFVIIEKTGVIKGLWYSIVLCFKNFSKVFIGYLVSWTLIVSTILFIGIFTLGIGLILVIPTYIVFLSILNMTYFYGKTFRRYYVDNKIFETHILEI